MPRRPCVQAASRRAKSRVQVGAALPGPVPQGRVGLGEPRYPAGVGPGDRGQSAVGPGPGAEHPGRGLSQRGRRRLGRGEPADQPHRVGGSVDLAVPVPLAAVRADRDQRLLGGGQRRRRRAPQRGVIASARVVNRASKPASSTRERLARACLPSSVPASSARIASARSQSTAALVGMAVVRPAGDQGLGRLAEGAQRELARCVTREVTLFDPHPRDEDRTARLQDGPVASVCTRAV